VPITIALTQIAAPLQNTVLEVGNGSGPFEDALGNLYLVCTNPVTGVGQVPWANGANPPVAALLHCYQSTNNGVTWTELDLAHAVAVTQPNANLYYGSPTAAVQINATTFVVAFTQWNYTAADPPTLQLIDFHMDTGLWGAISAAGPTVPLIPITLSVQYRASDGSITVEWDGQQETVGGSSYNRAFYAIYNAGWGAAIAIDPAQTGSTSNYALSGGVSGSGNRTHFFYTADTGTTITLDQATLTGGNVLEPLVVVTAQPSGQLPQVTEPWQQNGTTIGVSYGKRPLASVNQYMSVATSANAPVFTETLVQINSGINAIQSAGTNGASGLVGVDDSINASGYPNTSWSGPVFVGTRVGESGNPPENVGQPIAYKNSTGWVVNSTTEGEDSSDPSVQFFAFAPGGKTCLLNTVASLGGS
jgi:hypothetical protein